VIIDAEHSPWTPGQVQLALSGYSTSPTVVFVRIPSHDSSFIKRILDVGADGIVCPLVRTAEEARWLVAETRYPPAGTRGFGPRRAATYGFDVDRYVEAANDNVLIMPQIEDAAYASEAIGIMETPGISALCLGPTDLSGSMGMLRQFYHPEVQSVLNPILAAAKSRGIGVCTGIVTDMGHLTEWVGKGASLPLIAMDTSLIAEGATATIAAAKRLVAQDGTRDE
jgi:2-keto-3-deoxy-L-rhamnonate aldolase RhmA